MRDETRAWLLWVFGILFVLALADLWREDLAIDAARVVLLAIALVTVHKRRR